MITSKIPYDVRNLFQCVALYDKKVLIWVSLYVVGDLFPAGPISGIFVLWASISCNCDFLSKFDFWSLLRIPPQIVWQLYVHKIKDRGVVTTTRIKMAKTTLTGGRLNGDFTKYGQPVPRPDPTWGVGLGHVQLWGWRYPSCAQTVPFFLRMDIFSQYGEVINSANPRDSYMHHWPGSPLT